MDDSGSDHGHDETDEAQPAGERPSEDQQRESYLLCAADLFCRASKQIDRRSRHDCSADARMELERELADFIESNPNQPWNVDPKSDESLGDPFASGESLFENLMGMMYGEIRDAAGGKDGRAGKYAAIKRLVLFALCRSGQVLSEAHKGRWNIGALDATLEDATKALQRADLVRLGFAHPAEKKKRDAAAAIARVEGSRKGADKRWKTESEASYFTEILKQAAVLLAKQPGLTANKIGREIQEDMYDFRIKAQLPVDEDDNKLEVALQQYIRRHWNEVKRLADEISRGGSSDQPPTEEMQPKS